ncbi:hypothetical protein BLNAU_18537 [Blattamonas nauphoetae]|uniref:TmcB/TmcC TPR repeats domain-containing protein n=1 Tax=Blattamonas nauphoetae TaxID=2049346 RepID=A0ABQ9X452_9EUKA|nr:hypothetical protein BLNAU_18537 [Blattamonas nauphoetae]
MEDDITSQTRSVSGISGPLLCLVSPVKGFNALYMILAQHIGRISPLRFFCIFGSVLLLVYLLFALQYNLFVYQHHIRTDDIFASLTNTHRSGSLFVATLFMILQSLLINHLVPLAVAGIVLFVLLSSFYAFKQPLYSPLGNAFHAALFACTSALICLSLVSHFVSPHISHLPFLGVLFVVVFVLLSFGLAILVFLGTNKLARKRWFVHQNTKLELLTDKDDEVKVMSYQHTPRITQPASTLNSPPIISPIATKQTRHFVTPKTNSLGRLAAGIKFLTDKSLRNKDEFVVFASQSMQNNTRRLNTSSSFWTLSGVGIVPKRSPECPIDPRTLSLFLVCERDGEMGSVSAMLRGQMEKAQRQCELAKNYLRQVWTILSKDHVDGERVMKLLASVWAHSDEAKKLHQALLKRDPDNTTLLRAVGVLFRDVDRDDETAQILFNRATQLEEASTLSTEEGQSMGSRPSLGSGGSGRMKARSERGRGKNKKRRRRGVGLELDDIGPQRDWAYFRSFWPVIIFVALPALVIMIGSFVYTILTFSNTVAAVECLISSTSLGQLFSHALLYTQYLRLQQDSSPDMLNGVRVLPSLDTITSVLSENAEEIAVQLETAYRFAPSQSSRDLFINSGRHVQFGHVDGGSVERMGVKETSLMTASRILANVCADIALHPNTSDPLTKHSLSFFDLNIPVVLIETTKQAAITLSVSLETDLHILLVVTIMSCVVCCLVFFVAVSLAFVLTASAYHKHRMVAMRKFIDCPKKVAKALLSCLAMEDEDEMDRRDRFDHHHHPTPKKATVLMRSSTAEELPAIVIEADAKVIETNSSDPIEVTVNGGEVLSGSVSTITPSIVLREVVENESVDKFEEPDAFDASKEEDEDDNTDAAHDDDHRSAILHYSSRPHEDTMEQSEGQSNEESVDTDEQTDSDSDSEKAEEKEQTNQPHSNSPSPKLSVEFTLTQRTAYSEAVSGSDNLSMQLARETTPSPLSSNPPLPSEKLLSPNRTPLSEDIPPVTNKRSLLPRSRSNIQHGSILSQPPSSHLHPQLNTFNTFAQFPTPTSPLFSRGMEQSVGFTPLTRQSLHKRGMSCPSQNFNAVLAHPLQYQPDIHLDPSCLMPNEEPAKEKKRKHRRKKHHHRKKETMEDPFVQLQPSFPSNALLRTRSMSQLPFMGYSPTFSPSSLNLLSPMNNFQLPNTPSAPTSPISPSLLGRAGHPSLVRHSMWPGTEEVEDDKHEEMSHHSEDQNESPLKEDTVLAIDANAEHEEKLDEALSKIGLFGATITPKFVCNYCLGLATFFIMHALAYTVMLLATQGTVQQKDGVLLASYQDTLVNTITNLMLILISRPRSRPSDNFVFAESTRPGWNDHTHFSPNDTDIQEQILILTQFFAVMHRKLLEGSDPADPLYITGDSQIDALGVLRTSGSGGINSLLHDETTCLMQNTSECTERTEDRLFQVRGTFMGLETLTQLFLSSSFAVSTHSNASEILLNNSYVQLCNSAVQFDLHDGLDSYRDVLDDTMKDNINTARSAIIVVCLVSIACVYLSFVSCLVIARNELVRQEIVTKHIELYDPHNDARRKALTWKDAFIIDLPRVDRLHQNVTEKALDLMDAMDDEETTREAQQAAIRNLLVAFFGALNDEEILFKKYKIDRRTRLRHERDHARIIRKLIDALRATLDLQSHCSENLIRTLGAWLTVHVLKSDRDVVLRLHSKITPYDSTKVVLPTDMTIPGSFAHFLHSDHASLQDQTSYETLIAALDA